MSDRPALELDHIVVAAATLAEGVDWCAATLGYAPVAGGKHPSMGTHNRIFGIGTDRFPRAYFEIIAVDPNGATPPRLRWFGLDEPALQRALYGGPRLIHWAARCADVDAVAADFRDAGFDPGEVVQAERETPRGQLRWRITVRSDGRRLCNGAVPALIEWGEAHPAAGLPGSGIGLAAVALGDLPDPFGTWLAAAVAIEHPMPGAAPLRVALDTPRGRVSLDSFRLEN